MDMLLYISIGIVIFLVGIFIGKKSMRCDGLFIVNDSDFDKTQWIIDVKIDPETIPSRKEIHLKVKRMDQNTDE